MVAGLVWAAPSYGSARPSNFFVQASDQSAQASVFVNAFYPNCTSHCSDNDLLVLQVTHGGSTYTTNAHPRTASVTLPGLTVGDPITLKDTTTNQMFTLTWRARPSATLGVCGGSTTVAGLLSAPQGSPVLAVPTLSFVSAQHPGNPNAQSATTTQFGTTSYSAHFVAPLATGDLVDAGDQWEAIVNGNDVAMQSVHETVVGGACSPTGVGTITSGGPPGVKSPGFTINLDALDLRHGLRDLVRGGLIVTLDLACPAGDLCGIAINVTTPKQVPVQAASARRRKKAKPKSREVFAFDTLARGYLSVGASGPTRVKVKATKTGKRRLAGQKMAPLVIIVTVRDKQAGTFTTVKQAVTLHR